MGRTICTTRILNQKNSQPKKFSVHPIQATEGVTEGCPLAAHLFRLALRATDARVSPSFGEVLNAGGREDSRGRVGTIRNPAQASTIRHHQAPSAAGTIRHHQAPSGTISSRHHQAPSGTISSRHHQAPPGTISSRHHQAPSGSPGQHREEPSPSMHRGGRPHSGRAATPRRRPFAAGRSPLSVF